MNFQQMVQWLQARVENGERGAAAVEYGLLVALIAAVIIAAVIGLQGAISGAFETVTNAIN